MTALLVRPSLLSATRSAFFPTRLLSSQPRHQQSQASVPPPHPPALQGIKVLDLTRILAGPFATQLLGDYGADVVKVEHPHGGDDTRRWGPPFLDPDSSDAEKESCYFLGINRNKRSVAIDLKTKAGQRLVQVLARKADVLVHNYIPSKLAEFGLDYETISALNPRLVYCEITGWGSSGPRSSSPGYDVVAASVGGFMHITGEPTGPPSKSGVALTDVATGLFAHGAIAAALYARETSGRGQKIECSLFESQLAVLVNAASNALLVGDPGTRMGTAHKSIVPYQVFPTQDGHITIAAMNDPQFAVLAETLGLEEMIHDKAYATNEARVANRAALVSAISQRLQEKPLAEWCRLFEAVDVSSGMFSYGPINNVTQAFEDSQAVARDMVLTVDHPTLGTIPTVGHAVKFSETKAGISRAPPLLGEHTAEVLREWLLMDDRQIDALREAGAVSPSPL